MSMLEGRFEPGVVTTSIDLIFNWARRNSPWPVTFGLACCAIEMTLGRRFRHGPFRGRRVRPSPRQSDVMIAPAR
jgi:NADH-quinone oxidoreductase subunit B